MSRLKATRILFALLAAAFSGTATLFVYVTLAYAFVYDIASLRGQTAEIIGFLVVVLFPIAVIAAALIGGVIVYRLNDDWFDPER